MTVVHCVSNVSRNSSKDETGNWRNDTSGKVYLYIDEEVYGLSPCSPVVPGVYVEGHFLICCNEKRRRNGEN